MKVGDAGRNDHRHRRNAARRRAERGGAEGRDQGSRRRHSDRPARHQPGGASARDHPRRGRRRRRRQHQRARRSQDVGGTAGDTFTDLVDPRRQAGRTAADDRRPVGGDDHPLRRVAEQLARASPRCRRCRSTPPAPTRSMAGGGVQHELRARATAATRSRA